MTSQQIHTLLTPPNAEAYNEMTVLFLNSQFQSLEDLGGLHLLAVEAEQHDSELQSHLSLSSLKINSLLSETRTSAESVLHTAQELSLLRHSLADELLDLSNDLVSTMSDEDRKSTLLEDIETLHRNLKELQNVKGYVELIQHALELSEASVTQFRTSGLAISMAAFSQYQSLQDFVLKVSKACSTVEDASGQQTIHLVEYLDNICDKTWAGIKDVLSSTLSSASEKLGWPMPLDYLSASPDDRRAFEKAFTDILQLQNIGEKIRNPNGRRTEKTGLYPLQALVHPMSLRFKYHFEGNRQTNRLDKPEWYFTHVLNATAEHRPFMDSVIQKLLSASAYQGINAWREFTILLLPLITRKLKHTIPALLPHPPLLAHTIYQALAFDMTLSETGFELLGTSLAGDREEKWGGTSEIILGNPEWFETWLFGEKKFVEDQYHELISAPDAWLFTNDDDGNHDHTSSSQLRSTNSARRMKALVEQITDRCSPLPDFIHRTRFLLSIQLPLLDNYHRRIVSSLDAFETLSSAFVRAVPGALNVSLGGKEEGSVHIDTRRLTNGVEGVQRLCKAFLSAQYLETSMQEWGEELFFLELWSEIKSDSALRSQVAAHHLLPDTTATTAGLTDDALFDALISRYAALIKRAEDMIVLQVCGEIESVLKAHFLTDRSSVSDTEERGGISLSQTLLAPVTLLSSHLTFLRTTIPQASLTSLYRRIASRLAEHILQRQILYRGQFSQQEAASTLVECQLWAQTCHEALGGSLGGGRERVDAPWAKLLQAASLASAEGDAWATILDLTFGTRGDEEWVIAMSQVGATEIGREEAARILNRRYDCDR